ncbi:MAG: hypothetical protein DRG78_16050 [Epsilonproteobacteria bacterium]|nr:MAG: hypothetical protein DRG78_16050 [Campylobacterota bacterium]
MPSTLPAEVQYSVDSMHELLEGTTNELYAVSQFIPSQFLTVHNRTSTGLRDLRDNTLILYDDWTSTTATTIQKEVLSYVLVHGSYQQLNVLVEARTSDGYHLQLTTGTQSTTASTYISSYPRDNYAWWTSTFASHLDYLMPYYNSTLSTGAITLLRTINNEVYNAPLINYKEQKRKQNRLKIAAKKAIKKGVSLFMNTFNDIDINLFLTGDGFIVKGKHYNYRFSKTRSIIKSTIVTNAAHIPYKLELLTKVNDTTLCDVCVVIKDTPVIDQIIGVILHIRNGVEELILDELNINNKTAEFYVVDSHYLTERFPAPRPKNIIKKCVLEGNTIGRELNGYLEYKNDHILENEAFVNDDISRIVNDDTLLETIRNPEVKFDELCTDLLLEDNS